MTITIILILIAIALMMWKLISYKRQRKTERRENRLCQVVYDKGGFTLFSFLNHLPPYGHIHPPPHPHLLTVYMHFPFLLPNCFPRFSRRLGWFTRVQHFIVLNKCKILVHLPQIAHLLPKRLKSLLWEVKFAQNCKSCQNVAEHNLYRPIGEWPYHVV